MQYYITGFLFKENILTISHKNEFIENEDVEINETITLENVTDDAVQQEIFREFLENTRLFENRQQVIR